MTVQYGGASGVGFLETVCDAPKGVVRSVHLAAVTTPRAVSPTIFGLVTSALLGQSTSTLKLLSRVAMWAVHLGPPRRAGKFRHLKQLGNRISLKRIIL